MRQDKLEWDIQRMTRAEEIEVINAALAWRVLFNLSIYGEKRRIRLTASWRAHGALMRLGKAVDALDAKRAEIAAQVEGSQDGS